MRHTTVDPDEDDSQTLGTCQSDSNIVGGPREHSQLLGVLHIQYKHPERPSDEDDCVDGGVCAAHFAPTIAFILNESTDQIDQIAIEFASHNVMRGHAIAGIEHPFVIWRDGFAQPHA